MPATSVFIPRRPSPKHQVLLGAIALLLVAFGQPAWIPAFSLPAALGGYALFWSTTISITSPRKRFWLSTLWFSLIQSIQLSWFLSHPYSYIYLVYFFLILALGMQFGLLSLLITPNQLKKGSNLLGLAGLWTLFEWSRLHVLSGFSWNPVGLALASSSYALQVASLVGIYGLSFWVIWTNLLGIRSWLQRGSGRVSSTVAWLTIAALPYFYGALHLTIHEQNKKNYEAKAPPPLTAMLVQTAFPTEESGTYGDGIETVFKEWQQILHLTKKQIGHSIDLIVLPEFVVPYGTYSFIYPLDRVLKTFNDTFGAEFLKKLPSIDWPFAFTQKKAGEEEILVNNAYWIQGLANIFQSDVLAGLEDAEDTSSQGRLYYSAALYFHPQLEDKQKAFSVERYEKRVLVPMGEYIPFSFCKNIAARYGITGSFTPGKEAKIMWCKQYPFSASICYEETFGNLILEGKQKGAGIFVNLTSDVWYPNSRLPRQHFEHARLRTVENGVPLLRACNTGVTGVIDSLGRDVAILGGDRPEKVEWIPDTLVASIPTYAYSTFYSKYGNIPLLTFCCLCLCLYLWLRPSFLD